MCHQGDIYSASFAAVPHIVETLSTDPTKGDFDFFLRPAAIEIARAEKHVPMPIPLQRAYFEALSKLPALASAVLQPNSDPDLCHSALTASAVAAPQLDLGRLLFELDSRDTGEVIEWYRAR